MRAPLRTRIATRPGVHDHPNEDYVEARDDVVVLLDGAGIPASFPTGCQHGVHWFVRHLGPTLLDHATTSVGLDQALRRAISDVRALHADTCVLDHPYSPAATVIIVRVTSRVEALVLADSTLLVNHGGGQLSTLTDDRLQRLQDQLIREGRTPELGWMAPYANQQGGFWTAAATVDAADQAITRSWPRDQVTSLVLMSDGAARLVDLFGCRTWPELMESLLVDGPEAILERVRAVESTDPDHQRWPRTKTHDDATIALVDLTRPGEANHFVR